MRWTEAGLKSTAWSIGPDQATPNAPAACPMGLRNSMPPFGGGRWPKAAGQAPLNAGQTDWLVLLLRKVLLAVNTMAVPADPTVAAPLILLTAH
jgi:hypothetical protein